MLIDNLRTVGKDGKPKETPLAKEQLDHINQLVKDAVGYDESRGDSVNVVNASFTQDTAPAPRGRVESPKIWESPMFLDIAKIVGGLVVLLVLVLSVIRPLVKNLIAPTAQQMQVQVLPKQAAARTGREPADASQYAGAAQRRSTGRGDPRAADCTGPDPGQPGSEAGSAGRQRLGGQG